MMKRKARSDRNHAIYVITNVVTNEYYIGVTVCSGNVKKSLKVRIQKHVRRALTENKDWALCQNIRNYGVEAFTYGLVETVRGKADAHARERELTRQFNPTLNTL
jgi:predicted GIY-YIG superfamily endonuclease